jgi:3-hydroxymyristoyl/3-hydroxydecanoyl-(acyl carrier protein) dehydratase
MLPGVAQVVALVDAEARRAFPSLATRGARGLGRLKFQATIRPGDVLHLGLSLEPGAEPRVRFRIDRVTPADAQAHERATSGVLTYTAERHAPVP